MKKQELKDKPHICIGTIGHVDHGKTTLTAAIGGYLSGIDVDRIPEEKGRGITINTSYIEHKTKSCHYAYVDCLKSSNEVKDIIDNVSSMDGVILLIDVSSYLAHETREYILLSCQMAIDKMVVFMNKCDKVNDEQELKSIEMEVRRLLGEYGFDGDNTPIIRGSALKALKGDSSDVTAIGNLVEAVNKWIPKSKYTNCRPETLIPAVLEATKKDGVYSVVEVYSSPSDWETEIMTSSRVLKKIKPSQLPKK